MKTNTLLGKLGEKVWSKTMSLLKRRYECIMFPLYGVKKNSFSWYNQEMKL